jgi:DNA-binding NarL/FixJ family response regulator
MIMIDRRVLILAGPPTAPVRAFTIIRAADVILAVSSLFWAAWESATALADFRRDRPPALTDQSRAILTRLGAGLKDETAARQLGLSLRTYRRRVAELMTLLGAETRFQAGIRARELGL